MVLSAGSDDRAGVHFPVKIVVWIAGRSAGRVDRTDQSCLIRAARVSPGWCDRPIALAIAGCSCRFPIRGEVGLAGKSLIVAVECASGGGRQVVASSR